MAGDFPFFYTVLVEAETIQAKKWQKNNRKRGKLWHYWK